MQQGWIEWAKVCKLTILHDLESFTWGTDHNYVLVDIVMTRGVCFIYDVVQLLSKPCLSLSFAFSSESKMSAAAPAFSLPWSGSSPHCMRLRLTPPPLLCSLNYLMIRAFFSCRQIFFSYCFFVIYHAFFWFISTWHGLHSVRGLCVCASFLLLNAVRCL